MNINNSYYNKNICPVNSFSYYIGENPSTTSIPLSTFPKINPSAFIGPFSSVIGDVTIDDNVFVGCNVTIRADEGSPFYIGKNSNLQDGVILHGTEKGKVFMNDKLYSIYISNDVSCAHGSLIHGPCLIKNNVFVGFNSIVYNAIVGKNCFIGLQAVVTGKVTIPDNRSIPSGSIIDTQEKANALAEVTQSEIDFANSVLFINKQFPGSYPLTLNCCCCNSNLCTNLNHMNNFH